MNKTILLILALIASSLSNGQLLVEAMLAETNTFGSISRIEHATVSDSVKLEMVNGLKEFRYFDYVIKNYDTAKSDFIFLDVNNDQRIEMLYSGYLGGAAELHAYCFINKGDHFSSVFFDYGSWEYQIHKDDIVSGLIFIEEELFDPCHQWIKVERVTFNGDLERQLMFMHSSFVKQPDNYLGNKISFQVINDKYHLRYSPEINNDKSEHCKSNGNVIATYSNGDTGVAIAQKEDNTGRIWWYVIMHDKKTGWMSSRYLTRNMH